MVAAGESERSFESLGLLRPELLEAVHRLGFGAMTPIQAMGLPAAIDGRDVVGKAKTGSGKTAVFGLALLQQLDLALDHRGGRPQAIVLSPTRELATQLVDAIRALAASMQGVRVLSITGGQPSRDQRARLESGAHVVVATPGRCLQLLELGNLDPSHVKCLVLDEADRLLDMGFEEEVNRILKFLPPPGSRQTLLFSATWADGVERLSERVQMRPQVVSDGDVTSREGAGSTSSPDAAQVDRTLLRQSAVLFEGGETARLDALCHVLSTAVVGKEEEEAMCVVFCETRLQCKEVADFLSSCGASALALHGELEQAEREKVLVRFRNRSCRVLVATNVASRGLDVEGVSLVVCFELNDDPAVHVHRVGRTARANTSGEAVSLVHVGGSGGVGEGRGWRSDELARLDSIDQALGGDPISRHTWKPPSGSSSRPIQLPQWAAEWQTVLVLGGRRDKLRPGDILGALSGSEVGLEGHQVGKIDVTEQRTWVAVKKQVAGKAAQALNVVKVKKQRFKAHLVR
jgi:ATP-dependent RNA helicase DbpA